MGIQWSDVELVDASLDVVEAGARALILEYVNEVLSVTRLGGKDAKKTRIARVYMAAHLGEMWRRKNDRTAESADVQSETISGDSFSVSYAANPTGPDADSLDETSHGRTFKAIARPAFRVGLIPGCR